MALVRAIFGAQVERTGCPCRKLGPPCSACTCVRSLRHSAGVIIALYAAGLEREVTMIRSVGLFFRVPDTDDFSEHRWSLQMRDKLLPRADSCHSGRGGREKEDSCKSLSSFSLAIRIWHARRDSNPQPSVPKTACHTPGDTVLTVSCQ